MSMLERAAASAVVKDRLSRAARVMGAADPVLFVGPLIDRSFPRPLGQADYGENTLMPGAVPVEPSFSERESRALRFSMEPVVGASPNARVQEATREMRRLVHQSFGDEALKWFDTWSEEWRGATTHPTATYGAWFGLAVDGDGLTGSKVYYELAPEHLDALPARLRAYVVAALESMPGLVPLFTSLRCGRWTGVQRVTLLHRGSMRLTDLAPLLDRLGLAHQLPGLMQVVGLALGGRFELPELSVMLGLQESESGPEVKLEIALGMIPDLPPTFLDLLSLALAERPRELRALDTWLAAFSPEAGERPGQFSVMSVRVTRSEPARVSLYLRPVEFELRGPSSVPLAAHAAHGVAMPT
ncbi:MAG: hypothetical protein ACT4R6_07785 [Gemmatimonadaceae bacterium]